MIACNRIAAAVANAVSAAVIWSCLKWNTYEQTNNEIGSCFGIKARDCVQSVLRFCLVSSTINLVQILDAAMSQMNFAAAADNVLLL